MGGLKFHPGPASPRLCGPALGAGVGMGGSGKFMAASAGGFLCLAADFGLSTSGWGL